MMNRTSFWFLKWFLLLGLTSLAASSCNYKLFIHKKNIINNDPAIMMIFKDEYFLGLSKNVKNVGVFESHFKNGKLNENYKWYYLGDNSHRNSLGQKRYSLLNDLKVINFTLNELSKDSINYIPINAGYYFPDFDLRNQKKLINEIKTIEFGVIKFTFRVSFIEIISAKKI